MSVPGAEVAGPTERSDETVTWGPGFHGPEFEQGRPFRWMGRSATLAVAASDGVRYLRLAARCRFDDLSQSLVLNAGGAPVSPLGLVQGWNVVSFEMPPGATEVRLELDKLVPLDQHPGDGRDLGVQISHPTLHADAERHQQDRGDHESRLREARSRLLALRSLDLSPGRGLRHAHGFYQPEIDEGRPFRWLSRRGRLELTPLVGEGFLEMWVRGHFPDGSQTIVLAADGNRQSLELVEGWDVLSFPLPAGAGGVDLEVDKAIPLDRHPSDRRELALQIGALLVHDDTARHGHVSRQHANRVENARELRAARVELASLPPKLGIDIAGSCNVKPPCVYCDWDTSKEREGDNVDLPFNLFTLREYGPFFDNAVELVNCSIGEPFMVKTIDALLDAFGSRGKLLELTTNGQILTDVNIKKLLGRHVNLYISLDAATRQTYARLRNDTLPRILDNIRRLVEAKGGPGNPPHVYLVFMPMRANVHEVDDFVRLCARLRVDRLVLRPLNPSPGTNLLWDRAGYHYDYQQELLPFEELVSVSGRVAELCARYDVALSDQMDFGGDMGPRFHELYELGRREGAAIELQDAFPGRREPPAADAAPAPVAAPPAFTAEPPPQGAPVAARETQPEGSEPLELAAAAPSPEAGPLPICTEPWTSLYILRRGTFPCCYGGGPIAPMADFKQAWNSPLMKEIRTELRAGRFHRYCFDSPDCPIVRKAHEARDMPAAQELLFQTRRALDWVRRAGYGVPGRAYRVSKHYWRLAVARLRRTFGAGPPARP